MSAKSEIFPEITGLGEILDRNIASLLQSEDPIYRERALDSLSRVVAGALLSAGYDERVVRHLSISFAEGGLEPDDPLLEQVRLDLEKEFGTTVVKRILIALRPLAETYPEDTAVDLREIKSYWTGHGFFEIPKEAGRFVGLIQADFEDVYDLKSMHRKGDGDDEELALMRVHNRKILEFLVSLGWNPPDYINPDNLD